MAEELSAGRSIARTWLVAFGIATVLGLLDALPDLGGVGAEPWAAVAAGLARELLPWYGWAAFSPVVLALAARIPLGRVPIGRGAFLHLAAGTALSTVKLVALLPGTAYLYRWQEQGIGMMEGLRWLMMHRLPGNLIMYLLFATGATVLLEQRRIRDQEIERARLTAELAQSELQLLRAQLEPHFLFNVLNAVTAYVRLDPPLAQRMLSELSELLRLVLRASAVPDVALEDELRIVERYAEIHRMRFGEGLSFRLNTDRDVATARVPGVLLQPLVENAIQHASGGSSPGVVSVRAFRRGEQLVLSVTNSLGSGKQPGSGSSVGLANTRSRLARIYGSTARVDLRIAADSAVAEIAFPLRLAEGPA